jgi:virulence factor Mce-like protein
MTPRLKDLIDPVSARVQPRPLRNGAILFGLIGLAVYMALSHNIPIINGKPGVRLRADFAFANHVLPGKTPVRVDGVPVGVVDDVGAGPDPRRSSRVEMRITDKGVVLHSDARAEIRWRTLLGGRMYIDLEPGSARARRVDDWVIPIGRTSSQTEFDDLLQPYDGGTAQAQRDIFRGLSGTLARPAQTRRAIEALPALETIGRGEQPVLGTQSGDLRKLAATTATAVEALGADTTGLQRLVTGARQTLGATNARRRELGQFLELSPPSLDQTLATMNRLRVTLTHLDPLVDRLRPGARELAGAAGAARPALAQARGLLTELRPVLRNTRPALADLGATADSATPVIDGLKPTVSRLNRDILPWLRQRDDEEKLPNYQAIGPFFSVLDMAAAEYDSIGYRLHLSTPGANNTLLTAAQTSFARSCMAKVSTARRRIGCRRMATVLAHGWLGRKRG